MKKSLAGGVGVVAVLVAVFGSTSPAGANNEFVGMTYEKAASQISQWGTPVIASREGSYLPTDQCIVVGNKMASFLDSSGRKQGGKVLLDLNCNDLSALNGHPGNSVTTAQGKQVMQAKQQASAISEDYEKAIAAGKTPACLRSDDEGASTRWCEKICTQSKACSAELTEAMGM